MAYIEKKRERRIRDRNRMRAKARKVGHIQSAMQYWDETKHCNSYRDYIQRYHIRNSEHLACCRCSQCGNPRRLFGRRTLQELRAFQ